MFNRDCTFNRDHRVDDPFYELPEGVIKANCDLSECVKPIVSASAEKYINEV